MKKIIIFILTGVCLLLLTLSFFSPINSQKTDYNNTSDHNSFLKTSHFSIPDTPFFTKENGYRVSWSHTENLIAFDQKQSNEYYDVYVMNPDGTNELCLTDNPALPSGHKGCADWHPSGNYIVFTCQKERYFGKYIPILRTYASKLAIPGSGINCDLWLTNAEGTKFWQLTDLPTKTRLFDKQPYTGVLHPHFSHDGSNLLWSERIDSADNKWGEWTLNIADFIVKNGQPHLENITVFQPGQVPCFYESHGFSPDDTKIIFSGNLKKNQDENHMDIYTMDLQTEEVCRLTIKNNEWDEHAHYSPDGNTIVWMSSNGYGMNTERNWWDYLKTEYWLMDTDGSNKTQLTFYNDNTTNDQRITCSDCSFNADGTKLATTTLIQNETTTTGGIIILNLSKTITDSLVQSDTPSPLWDTTKGPFGGDRTSFFVDPHNTNIVFVDSCDNSGVWVSQTAGESTGDLTNPAWQHTMFDYGYTKITGSSDNDHTYVYSTGARQKGVIKRLKYPTGENPILIEWENKRFANSWEIYEESGAGLQIITDPYRPERIMTWFAIASAENRELQTHPSLFLSEDYGDTWTTIDLDLNAFPSELNKDRGIAIPQIAFDPNDEDRFNLVSWYEQNLTPTSTLVSYHRDDGWNMLVEEVPFLIRSFDFTDDLNHCYVVFSYYGPLPDYPFAIAKKKDEGYIWDYPEANLLNEPVMDFADVREFMDIRLHPHNSSILFMSANSADFNSELTDYEVRGTFKSEDGGATWRRVLKASKENAAFHKKGSTRFDPKNPDVMYMGLSGFSSIRKSVDGGETWTRKMEGLNGINLFGVAFTDTRVYAVVQSKLAINEDKMTTANWTTRYIADPDGSGTANFYGGVEVDPFNENVVLVGAGKRGLTGTGPNGGVFRNDHAGFSDCPSTRFCENGWERVIYDSVTDDGKMNPQIMDIFFSETTPGLVFAVAESNKAGGAGGEKGIYMSSDHGKTWNWIYDEQDMFFVAQDPYNPDLYYAVGGEKDHGGRIITMVEDSTIPSGIHIIDSGDISLVAENDYLYSIGIQEDLKKSEACVFIGSSRGIIYRISYLDLQNFDFNKAEIVKEIGPAEYISAVVAVHPDHPNYIYAGGRSYNNGIAKEKQGIHRSTDGGDTWQRYSQGLKSSALDIFEIKFSPDGKRLYAGTLSSIATLDLENIGESEIINVSSTFGRVKATITTGENPVNCSIIIDGKIWFGSETNVELPSWSTETVQTSFISGYGNVEITVTVNNETEEYEAFLLGPIFLNFQEV